MCARELDRRFFGRGVQADIAVLAPVALGEGDVPHGSALEKRKDLLDALAHLDEVGSLLAPGEGDLAAIREAMALTGDGSLFGSSSREKLQRALSTCETLARRHDCVVANPPYMGSSSFGPFMSKWVKKSYSDVKSDLCTCFIERNLSLAKVGGFASLVTSDTCMYLSSFVAMRTSLVENNTILTFVDTRGTNAHPDVFDANAIWVLRHGRLDGYEGSYFKLNHRIPEKAGALLEAIRNPDCGWFYRRDAETFKQIPGTPIAYWASDGVLRAFKNGKRLSSLIEARQGFTSGDNERFLRLWFEPSMQNTSFVSNCARWFPCDKGGNYRKWYGNNEYVADWQDDGKNLKEFPGSTLRNSQYYLLPAFSWSDVSSAFIATRYKPAGFVFEHCSDSLFGDLEQIKLFGAFLNSSTAADFLKLLSPSMKFEVGQIRQLPVCFEVSERADVLLLVDQLIQQSQSDWDSLETSWNFKRHPLV